MARRNDRYSEPAFPITQFIGLNNKAEPRAMAPGELTRGDNVDIDDRGKLRRRRGYALAKAMTAVTSAWSTPDEERAFVVGDGGKLFELDAGLDVIELASGLGTGPVWFDWDTQRVFVMSEQDAFVIDGLEAYPLRIPTPPAPSVFPVTGNLPAGRYMVATVYQDAVGRQGGASRLSQVMLSEGQAIEIRATALAGFAVRHYVSSINGTDVRQLAATDAAIVFDSLDQLGATIEEAQYGAAPAQLGGPIAFYQARLWTATYVPEQDATAIFSSRAFWPHLFDQSRDGFTIDHRVNLLVGIEGGGLVIGTDQSIYVQGLDQELVQVADYGTVPGPQNFYRTHDGSVYLWTHYGIAKALPFESLTKDRLAVPGGSRCAVGMVREGGFDRLVVGTHVTAEDAALNTR